MPLSSFRVLQIGSGIALDYCGKLFADLGADTIRLEPAGGDPLGDQVQLSAEIMPVRVR